MFEYDTNVFKNVKLGLSPEDLKKEEDKIKALATYLNEHALDKLIKDFQLPENLPVDSESLESAFHSHGINMRYLGAVMKKFKDSSFNHMQFLLEKEIVLRAAKHILNDYMRVAPATYVSSVVAHLMNLLLAPFPMLDLIEEGKI